MAIWSYDNKFNDFCNKYILISKIQLYTLIHQTKFNNVSILPIRSSSQSGDISNNKKVIC